MIRDLCLGLGMLHPSFLGLGHGTGKLCAVIVSMGGVVQEMSCSVS